MSEGAGAETTERGKTVNGQKESKPLPEWFLLGLHAPTHLISRALWRISFRGAENIPRESEGGLVVAANHQTYVDPFWISIPIRRAIRFLAWSKPFQNRALGKLMDMLGAWPLQIDRGDARAYRRSLQWLKRGGALVIFPEGGRAGADGEPSNFKTGAARLALESGVPILPVTIRGGHRIWPRDRKWPRMGRVEIVYHPLQRLEQKPGEDSRQCARRETERLEAQILSAL